MEVVWLPDNLQCTYIWEKHVQTAHVARHLVEEVKTKNNVGVNFCTQRKLLWCRISTKATKKVRRLIKGFTENLLFQILTTLFHANDSILGVQIWRHSNLILWPCIRRTYLQFKLPYPVVPAISIPNGKDKRMNANGLQVISTPSRKQNFMLFSKLSN